MPAPSTSTGPLLSGAALSKAFGAQFLFEGVTLHVFDTDRIGVIGPNGAGKSTLLRILAGLEPPDQGTHSVRRFCRVALVPQESRFPEGATVGGVLETALEPLLAEFPDPVHERDGRVAEVLGRTGFSDRDQTVSALSGGWLRRLAIARGLVVRPGLQVGSSRFRPPHPSILGGGRPAGRGPGRRVGAAEATGAAGGVVSYPGYELGRSVPPGTFPLVLPDPVGKYLEGVDQPP